VSVERESEAWPKRPISFDTDFVGKQIYVKGRVEAVQERFSSGYRITIGSGSSTLDCNVPEEHIHTVLPIRQGQMIEVRGTVEYSFFGFDLYNCHPIVRQ
jgi:hypothetical protein